MGNGVGEENGMVVVCWEGEGGWGLGVEGNGRGRMRKSCVGEDGEGKLWGQGVKFAG